MRKPRHWEDIVTALLGLQLLVAPRVIDYQGDGIATANAVAAGITMVITGVVARLAFRRAIEGVNALVALWLLVSPFALGFVNVKLAAQDAWVTGAAEVLLVIWTLLAREPRELPWTKADPE
jgi:site-specific recombinase